MSERQTVGPVAVVREYSNSYYENITAHVEIEFGEFYRYEYRKDWRFENCRALYGASNVVKSVAGVKLTCMFDTANPDLGRGGSFAWRLEVGNTELQNVYDAEELLARVRLIERAFAKVVKGVEKYGEAGTFGEWAQRLIIALGVVFYAEREKVFPPNSYDTSWDHTPHLAGVRDVRAHIDGLIKARRDEWEKEKAGRVNGAGVQSY